MEFLIITGLSGGGKTQAAHFLEDLGYYCVDNMPVALLQPFAEFCVASRGRFEKVALVTDARSQNDFGPLLHALDVLREAGCLCRILFMEASAATIVRRYKESRRRHPLALEDGTIQEAVERESALMATVRRRADYIIDTSATTLGQLHKEICRLFLEGGKQQLPVSILSFGYKYGLPLEADMVFDARFLPNPYYVSSLRELCGLDAPVRDFVLGQKDAPEFLRRLAELIDYLLPRFQDEGKQSLTIAVGCTGGRHRSVALAAALSAQLLQQGQNVRLINRDLNRSNEQ